MNKQVILKILHLTDIHLDLNYTEKIKQSATCQFVVTLKMVSETESVKAK